MATLAFGRAMDQPPRRRKPVTYGKQSHKSSPSLNSDFDELGPEVESPSFTQNSSRLKSPRKPLRARPLDITQGESSLDEFDIPSSGDEKVAQEVNIKTTGRLTKVGASSARLGWATTQPSITTVPRPATSTNKKRKLEAPWDELATSEGSSKAIKISRSSSPHRSLLSPRQRSPSPTCADGRANSSHILSKNGKRIAGNTTSRLIAPSTNLFQRDKIASQYATPPEEVHEKRVKSLLKGANRAAPKAVIDMHSGPFSAASGHTRRPSSTLSEPTLSANETDQPIASLGPPSTPRRGQEENLLSTPASGFTTPRQAKLWNQLLQHESPSRSFNGLTLVYPEQGGIDEYSPEPETTPRRVRLIDALQLSTRALPSSDLVAGDEDVTARSPDVNTELTSELSESKTVEEFAASGEASQSSQSHQQPPNGPRFTYGAQRSYLEDNDSLEALLLQPIESPSFGSGVDRQSKDETTGVFDVSDDEDMDTKPMRSVHELKAAGKSGAFANEVNTILDDLVDHSKTGLSRLRGALMDLSLKLTDPGFRSRFIQIGYERRLFSAIQETTDDVACAITCALVVLLLQGDKGYANPTEILAGGAVGSILMAMKNDRELVAIARERRCNMSRVAQGGVHDVQSRMLKLHHWDSAGAKSLTPCLVALKALELLVRRLRESGNVAEPFLDPPMLQVLQDIMKGCSTHIAGAKMASMEALFKLEMALSILESCTVAQVCVRNTVLWNTRSTSQLAETLELALSVSEPESRTIPLLGLRLVVTLANHSPQHADGFATLPLISGVLQRIRQGLSKGAEELADKSQLELLVLGLGAMINLAESSALARQVVASDGLGFVDGFVDAFNANRSRAGEADSLEASHANVAYGYLAVLFGHLCQTSALRQRIQARLPHQRLDAVVEAVEEFIAYHQEADRRDSGNEAYASFTERLRAVAATLQRLSKEGAW